MRNGNIVLLIVESQHGILDVWVLRRSVPNAGRKNRMIFNKGQIVNASFGAPDRHKSLIEYVGIIDGDECFKDCETGELYPFDYRDGNYYLLPQKELRHPNRVDFQQILYIELS